MQCRRGFQTLPCAQVVREGHGFIRNRRDDFDRRGDLTSDLRILQAPRLVRAWDDLTQVLIAA